MAGAPRIGRDGRAHFVTAFRYIASNPVRAGLVDRPEGWPWSSTRAFLAARDDHVVKVAPGLERVGDFAAFLGTQFDEGESYAALRKAESVGRPIGTSEWLADMEALLGRTLAPRKRGPSLGCRDCGRRLTKAIETENRDTKARWLVRHVWLEFGSKHPPVIVHVRSPNFLAAACQAHRVFFEIAGNP